MYLKRIDKSEEEKLNKLLQLYLHDLSYDFKIEFDSKTGLYLYNKLDKYFNKSGNHAYFIKIDDDIIGFVFVDKLNDGMCVQEFFVMNNYKRLGIGSKIAFNLFDKFKGNWIVKAVPLSLRAENFWKSTINKYIKGNYKVKYVGKYNRAEFEFNNKMIINKN